MPRKPRDGKYKMKTHKATSKRFRTTGSGAILRTKIGKGHFCRRTPARIKQLFERMLPVKSKGTQKKVRRLAPYMGKKK